MVIRDGMDGAHRDAGCIHVQQQKGNALLRAAIAAGADKAEHLVRELRVRCPNLRAIEHIMIAITLRPQRE